ncbi:LysR family transcriptional regulator [Kaistia sp. 32K]|uniref:SDR family oxidoreductase n=1 Tax=Kaistia sp. 32K TaxID=2795690 RepID=UPI001914F52B|nr:SDR family oxidoreductase [Kaistia sp. 32K]BCP55579.1 LysR family transcriptional regulator [Kaistia sp. 32K]
MKIVIMGGTGLIGSRLTAALRAGNHEVIPASPSMGVDAVTGEGLAAALHGARIVVDVSNSPSLREDVALEFFRTAGRNLLAAEEAAGVRHHVALSVVGADRLAETGYFRAKMAQENLIRASGIPYTILRSAPFFEYLGGIIETEAEGGVLRVPPAHVCPIAAEDVVVALRDVVLGRPQNRELAVIGPESLGFDEIASQLLAANEDPRAVVADAGALYFGAVLRDDTLAPRGHPRHGTTRFGDWLRLYVAQALAPAF